MSLEDNELSKYLKQLQSFQDLFQAFFDGDDDKNFQALLNFFENAKVFQEKKKFITALRFISRFSSNHHRSSNFVSKIDKILSQFQPFCQQHCTNTEIFDIFKENKLILLILFNKKILLPDTEIYSIITSDSYKKRNYPEYFYKEFQFLKEDQSQSSNISEDNDEKRQLGENDNLLCTLIRKDDFDQFIQYLKQFKFDSSTQIEASIYETNPFLIEKVPTIIEYASFFGSIQIIRYLICNNIPFTEKCWLYSIHSKNYELIHLLEEQNVEPENGGYTECLLESIRCHHNEIADYILNNKISNNDNDLKKTFSIESVKYHNYYFIPNDYEYITSNPQFMVTMCEERYYEFVHTLLHMQVGPGILCSCVDATFGSDTKNTLFCAVKNNDIEMVKVLMTSETFNTYGKSTITREVDNSDGVDDIYGYKDSKTALYLAVEKRYYDIVKLLLSSSIGININEESELSCAHKGHLEETKDKEKKCPIHLAVENGDDKMLELLLASNDIDINIECKSVKDVEKPYVYISNQVEKKTPLIVAVDKENVCAVKLLLAQKKIDVNKKSSLKYDKKLDGFDYDEDNQGNEEEEQKDDNERDKYVRSKKTSLHLAVEKGNIEIVKLLLNHCKIDVNCREKYVLIKPLLKIYTQKTALQIAIEKKRIDIVEMLLEKRSISINERIPYKFDKDPKTCPKYDEDGNEIYDKSEGKHIDSLKTPLHVAVLVGCVDIIKLLLNQKYIDCNIDDGQGKLPIDYTDDPKIKELFPKSE